MSYFPIHLNQVFSVEKILKSRGFYVQGVGTNDALIIKGMRLPLNSLTGKGVNPETELVYEVFNDTVLRKELHSFVHKRIPLESTQTIQLSEMENFQNTIQHFSTTFEWYIGELMVRKFSAMGSEFGVTVSGLNRLSESEGNIGDFDVITVLRDLGIAFFECKTGKFNQKKILMAIERSIALHCEFVIICVDSIVKSKNLFQQLSNCPYPLMNGPDSLIEVKIPGSDIKIYKWEDCYFISGEADIEKQISIALQLNSAKKTLLKQSMKPATLSYSSLGFEIEVILQNKVPGPRKFKPKNIR